jgi:isoaspartyl peptidase/L-asparaginase-like protein (Ntn-hydrolase superfamily)
MRILMARAALEYLQNGIAPFEAARRAVDDLEQLTGSTGGLILIDPCGQVAYARNTSHMPICSITSAGEISLAS